MANKVRGEIAADFEGGKINLILSTNAICELEDAADLSIMEFLDLLKLPKPRMKTMRLMFWAMMLNERPQATIADAGKVIDGLRGKHEQVMTAAVVAAFPEANKGGEGQPGK